jgi:molybdenum cofactor synthesis domain-containing protein
MAVSIRAVVLTISDSASRNLREDVSGPTVALDLFGLGCEVLATQVLPDDRSQIADRLRHFCDVDQVDLIVTTGGTGLSPRDVTPEATLEVIEREVPGLSERMRAESRKITPLADLSRAVCGVRGRTLIINLPGSIRGARENLEAVARTLPHAISLLSG